MSQRTSKQHSSKLAPSPRIVRCAVYTRKSSEEGLEQEFNSLDAQREAGEAYIKSQQHEGWQVSAERYDDGGFTGGNMERPALQRLMADITAGAIQCVVVYKVDRLSRSLLDFARMMESFEKNQVAFVSVTQQFNTATSMGRLVLNVLLSFAQFEREIIGERTRDKIAATRRKGKWSGGPPILGYDLDPRGSRILVNEEEAERVRSIFALYLKHNAILPVVQELAQRGWHNKSWTTRKGKPHGGNSFNKSSLHNLLTNVVSSGKLVYKGEVFPGEHTAIVDPVIWQQVQDRLAFNRRFRGGRRSNQYDALLLGLLRCKACDCSMSPSATCRKTKRYRYYICASALQRGRATCPTPSLPAGEIERYVCGQLLSLESDPHGTPESAESLEQFRSIWPKLAPADQIQVLRRLVQRIDYDGTRGTIAIIVDRDGMGAYLRERNFQEETSCPQK